MRASILVASILASLLGVAFPAVAALGEPAAAPPKEIVLTGTLTGADHQTYRLAPFLVPAGTTRLTLDFDYTGRDQKSVIDLGLMDPTGFRGWSGGSRKHVVISATDTTPGYLNGPVQPGAWNVLMGAPNLRQGAAARYTARIRLESAPGPVELAAAPIVDKPGWYRGDLHMHTANSDGSCPAQSGARAPCPVFKTVDAAARRKLDFIAITDHNTTAQLNEMRELQESYDRLLLIPGRELTTFFGHANVFGPAALIDFRLGSKAAPTAAAIQRATHEAGGMFSINHPTLPSGEACMGCGWTAAGTDDALIDAVEVVNGSTLKLTGSAEGPLQSLAFWQAELNASRRVTAIGGSDNHDATIPLDRRGAIGSPTTVVYAPSLSTAGILAGLRSGRVFIDVDAPLEAPRSMDFTADDGRTVMGSVRLTRPGETVTFVLRASVAPPAYGETIVDGVASRFPRGAEMADLRRGVSVDITIAEDGKPHWVRANVRDDTGRLILIGNPIYLRPVAAR